MTPNEPLPIISSGSYECRNEAIESLSSPSSAMFLVVNVNSTDAWESHDSHSRLGPLLAVAVPNVAKAVTSDLSFFKKFTVDHVCARVSISRTCAVGELDIGPVLARGLSSYGNNTGRRIYELQWLRSTGPSSG